MRKFDLFISYTTDPDYQLARGLHRFLTTFHDLPLIRAKGIPALRVCIDGGTFLKAPTKDRKSVATLIEHHLEQSDQMRDGQCTDVLSRAPGP